MRRAGRKRRTHHAGIMTHGAVRREACPLFCRDPEDRHTGSFEQPEKPALPFPCIIILPHEGQISPAAGQLSKKKTSPGVPSSYTAPGYDLISSYRPFVYSFITLSRKSTDTVLAGWRFSCHLPLCISRILRKACLPTPDRLYLYKTKNSAIWKSDSLSATSGR